LPSVVGKGNTPNCEIGLTALARLRIGRTALPPETMLALSGLPKTFCTAVSWVVASEPSPPAILVGLTSVARMGRSVSRTVPLFQRS
jgi:hypothetical protein